jgi:hypothetical protein
MLLTWLWTSRVGLGVLSGELSQPNNPNPNPPARMENHGS